MEEAKSLNNGQVYCANPSCKYCMTVVEVNVTLEVQKEKAAA